MFLTDLIINSSYCAILLILTLKVLFSQKIIQECVWEDNLEVDSEWNRVGLAWKSGYLSEEILQNSEGERIESSLNAVTMGM